MNSSSPSSSKIFWYLFILALIALGVSVYLSYEHYSVLQRGFTGKSFCNINSYFNCDLVLSSRYASLGTIPLAGIGLLFYLYLLGALLYSRIASENAAKILVMPTIFIFGACLVSAGLAYISFAKLGSFCLFCSSLYLVNFLLLIGFALIYRFSIKNIRDFFDFAHITKSLLAVAAIFLIGLFLLHYQSKRFKQEVSPAELEKYLEFFFAQQTIDLDTQNRPFWGNPEAKIVIAEFSDFECPFCKLAAFNLKPLLTDYKDHVKLVFLNYPLDQSCNTYMPRQGHQHSCQLAYAAHCAMQQAKFWEYHDEIFDLQPKFAESTAQKIAKELGLDLEKFQACLQSEETKNLIAADIEQGQNKAQLTGTPTVYVNGRKLEYWYLSDVLKKVIERSLQN